MIGLSTSSHYDEVWCTYAPLSCQTASVGSHTLIKTVREYLVTIVLNAYRPIPRQFSCGPQFPVGRELLTTREAAW